jgi:DNA-binding NarL/FixJ family response regulator
MFWAGRWRAVALPSTGGEAVPAPVVEAGVALAPRIGFAGGAAAGALEVPPDGPLPVHVYATDALLRDGAATWLLLDPAVAVLDAEHVGEAGAVIAVLDELDPAAARDLERLRRAFGVPLLLIVPRIDELLLLRASEIGVGGVLRRRDVTAATLVGAARVVSAGDGSLPPDAIARLFGAMHRLQQRVLAPNGLSTHGLTERELRVLQLVADGLDTAEIARELSYSERTIKDILHQVTTRLGLRNRTHAVAYAMRVGAL